MHETPSTDADRPSAAATKALRLGLGLTQEQLAERAGLERVEVVNVERGRNQATSARVRDGLARGLGLEPVVMEQVLRGELSIDEARALVATPAAPPVA